jgi:type I restriction enzyme, S subunit
MCAGGNSSLIICLQMRFEESEYVRYGLKDGDLVICEGGEPGRCAVWRKEFGQHMQLQKALHRIRFTSSINSTFVQMYFDLCASNRRLEKMFTGTTIKHLTGEKLARMTIPICSVDEQKQILLELESRLSEVDQLDQTLTTALQQAEALRQSILKNAFSGQLVPQEPNDEPASVLLERIQAEKAALLAQKKTVIQKLLSAKMKKRDNIP